MTRFASFWEGRLPGLARACLASFPARGAELTLFSYDPSLAPPPGVLKRDARDICPDAGLAQRYRVGGRVSYATFADRFRYELMTREPFCWIDADILALRPQALTSTPIWGRQPEAKGKALVNNAVLGLALGDPVLADMLAAARAAESRDVSWGALGPFLLTEIAEAHRVDATASPPFRFYPIGPDDFWRLFDPASCEAVVEAARNADLLHLWSELLRRMDYDFDAAPPRGSYLHDAFAGIDALGIFRREATAREIAAMAARWRAGAPA